MATNSLLVKSYATNIYLTGSNSFENVEATRPEYVTPNGGPVMAYSAKNHYIDDIDNALTMGYINAQQHADTLALKTPTDPQYRNLSLAAQQTM